MKTHVMKTILILFVLSSVPAFADAPPWTGTGTYTFDDTDIYFSHSYIQDSATVNIIGGSFGGLDCRNYSTVNMSGGFGEGIFVQDYSILNLTGGNLNFLDGADFSQVHIYSLDYLISGDESLYYITGHWENGNPFSISLRESSWPSVSIHFIPEPGTILLLVFGMCFLKKQKRF